MTYKNFIQQLQVQTSALSYEKGLPMAILLCSVQVVIRIGRGYDVLSADLCSLSAIIRILIRCNLPSQILSMKVAVVAGRLFILISSSMRRSFVLPLLLLIGSHLAATAQDYYQLGVHAYEASDDSAAIAVQYFTRAIELNQQPAKSYMMKAAAEELQKNFTAATDDLNQSKALDSAYPKLYYYYGQLYLRQDLYFMSIRYFDIAIAKDPRQAKFYNARASARYFLYEYDKLVEDENKAIALDSTDESYFSNRGYALIELNQLDKAIADLTTSLRIRPSQKGYANRGYAYAQLSRQAEAIADYNESLRLVAKDGQTLYLRGISYLALGKRQEACQDLDQSAALNYQPALEKIKTSCKQ